MQEMQGGPQVLAVSIFLYREETNKIDPNDK